MNTGSPEDARQGSQGIPTALLQQSQVQFTRLPAL